MFTVWYFALFGLMCKNDLKKTLGFCSPKAIHIRGWYIELFLTFAKFCFSAVEFDSCNLLNIQ